MVEHVVETLPDDRGTNELAEAVSIRKIFMLELNELALRKDETDRRLLLEIVEDELT